MKTNNNTFKKIISITFAVLFLITPVKKAEAVCPWCYNIPQGVLALVEQTATAVSAPLTSASVGISASSNMSIYLKEYVRDRLVVELAKRALDGIKGQMTSYLQKGGFDGAPAFIKSPDQFFKNIASDQEKLIKKQLLGTEGGALYAQNKDIFKLLSEGVKDDGAAFQKSITSTIGSTICSKLNTELQKSITLNEDAATINALRVSYAASCTAGDKATQYKNQQDCAKNFSCGGFDSILAITQNLSKNTDAGIYEATRARYDKEVAKKTDEINKELDRGNGFVNKKKCKPGKTETVDGGTVCTEYEILSPGVTSVSILDQLIKEPVQKKLQVKTMNDVINAAADAFFTNILSIGIAEISSAVSSSDSGSNNTPTTGGVATGPSTGGPTTTTNPTSNASGIPDPDPMQLITGDPLNTYLKGYLSIIEAKGQQNKDSKVYVDKELGVYQNLLNSYNQVAACYKAKYEEQIDKNRVGALTYPGSIPEIIKTRASEVNNSVINLKDLSGASLAISTAVDKYIVLMKSSTYINILDYYRGKIEEEQGKSGSLSKVEWKIRDSRNDTQGSPDYPSPFNILRKEAANTLLDIKSVCPNGGSCRPDETVLTDVSPLGTCNAIDPNPQLKPVSNNGGSNN